MHPPRLETTLFQTRLTSTVLDEMEGQLRTFLGRFITDEGSNYEVEAKFGLFVDKSTNGRISLPVMNSCVLADGDWYRFESDLPVFYHRAVNNLLNEHVGRDPSAWKYRHDKTIDAVYHGPQRRKIRVTREAGPGGRILGAMEKRRIADLSLHIPASPVDVRISINTETKITIPGEETVRSWSLDCERQKDRRSYEYDHWLQVDLTQVFQGGSVRHELELEIVNTQQQLLDPVMPLRFICNLLDIARKLGQ